MNRKIDSENEEKVKKKLKERKDKKWQREGGRSE
jgi:hypothetical protein